ncbi:hypothetical protein QE152_g33804 [Popillia japonica]|uniref:Tc1-like transposase DDE domain-containing protein n=1 Tax=Popillia japonica TaxID=7064 RepID=A0AAW1IVH6_POPJA
MSILIRKCINTSLPHPPQSPDLNPIENDWHILVDLHLRKYEIPNKRDLKKYLQQAWNSISEETTPKTGRFNTWSSARDYWKVKSSDSCSWHANKV